jgi:hypothetical protein
MGLAGAPTAAALVQYEAGVTIDAVDVDAQGVNLSGEITSTGTDALFKVSVLLWINKQVIADTAALADLMAQDQVSSGSELRTAEAVETIVSGQTEFASGQTARFAVSATWEELGATERGAYLVGVNVRAASHTWRSPVVIGSGHTVVSQPADGTARNVNVVSLTATPAWLHDQVFADDHLADELAGRLRELVDFAKHSRANWLIDPALYYQVTLMADGYSVLEGQSLVDGQGQAVAQDWLKSVDALDPALGYRLPWGDPDLAYGAAAAGSTVLVMASQAQDADPTWAALPLLVLAPQGNIDRAFLDYLAPLSPTVVLAGVTDSVWFGASAVLSYQPVAFPTVVGAHESALVSKRQRALAEDLLADEPVIRLIASSDDADLAASLDQSWVDQVSLATVVPNLNWQDSDATPALPVGQLTAAIEGSLSQAQDRLQAWASLTGQDESAWSDRLRLFGLNRSWGSDAPAMTWLGAAQANLQSLLDQVELTAASEVSLTAKVTSFPVTVTNHLPVAVTVEVMAQVPAVMGSAVSISIPASGPVVIEPGDRVALTLTPTVEREGEAVANLHLATADGRLINQVVPVDLKASMSAWMGWVVVAGAVLLFAGGTLWRMRQKRRERLKQAGGGELPGQ